MSGVQLKNVTKKFGSVEVIRGVDITIEPGEFCVFVGPSGCGKSTLLRMIAGLEEITTGEVLIGGRVVNEVDPSVRGTAMVFQSYALYPHMTVERNMGFGLLMNGVPKAEVRKKVEEAARILQIEQLLERKPKQLSGGQRQRVAIGRAIVRDPQVFLFDEPLSNLDAELRVATRIELARLHHQLGSATMVYVTHDQVEAMTLASRIVVLRDGRVEQIGTPMDLYERPANLFVAGFIGSPKMNFMAVEADDERADGTARLPDGSTLRLTGADAGKAATLGVRADALAPSPARTANAMIAGQISIVERLGDVELVYVHTGWGAELVVKAAPSSGLAVGQDVYLAPSSQIHCFDAKGIRLPGITVAPAGSARKPAKVNE
jgi:ABC-type sugar transport system ATPase subunit